MIRHIATAMSVALAGAAVTTIAHAQDVKLPPTMTMTAYDTGTAGFNITVAIGKMLKDKYNSDVRVLPAGNDVARMAPLRAGRAVAASTGSGIYYAQEGVFEFGSREWGPQPVQIMLMSVDCNGGDLGVAADTGVKTIADLKGKRLGFVVGAPALNQNALAMLAFGGLTEKDVKIVEFASYGAMWKGIVNNDVDAVFGATTSGPAKELETSPRGIIWPTLPHSDNAGWDRVKKVAPYFTKLMATCGAGISKDKPVEMGTLPYPIYTVYAKQPVDQVYSLTKAMMVGYDAYKDVTPGAMGMDPKQQTKNWVVPIHAGAIKALKEVGAWSDDQDKYNEGLLKRQGVLATAWTDYIKTNPPSEDNKFLEGWLAARKTALANASLANGFDRTYRPWRFTDGIVGDRHDVTRLRCLTESAALDLHSYPGTPASDIRDSISHALQESR
jgi:TRAP transporter TAXI family solute receptor